MIQCRPNFWATLSKYCQNSSTGLTFVIELDWVELDMHKPYWGDERLWLHVSSTVCYDSIVQSIVTVCLSVCVCVCVCVHTTVFILSPNVA